MSARAAAMAAGISNTTWSNWERSGGVPGPTLQRAVSDLFGWPIEWPDAPPPAPDSVNRLDERVVELERQVSQLSRLVDFLMKDVEADEHDDPAPAATRSDSSSA